MLERRDGNIPINLEMLHDNIPPQVYFQIFLNFCVSYKKKALKGSKHRRRARMHTRTASMCLMT